MVHIENGKIYIPFDELPDIIRSGSNACSHPVRKRYKGSWFELFCAYGTGVSKKAKEITSATYVEWSFIHPWDNGVCSDILFNSVDGDPVVYWQQGNWPEILNWAINHNTKNIDDYYKSDDMLKI